MQRTSYIIFAVLIVILTYCSSNTENIEKLQEELKYNISEAKRITNGEKSLQFSYKALNIATNLNNEMDIAISCREISHDYERIGKLDSALFYTLKAAELYKKLSIPERVAMMYNNIGTLYFNQGDTILSINYLEEALTIHLNQEKLIYIGEDFNNLGEIYRLMNKPRKAIEYFSNALKYFTPTENEKHYAYTIGNIGLAYSSLGLLDSAHHYLEKSRGILYNLNDNYPITVYLTEDAKILLKNRQYKRALKQINQSINIAEKENYKQQLTKSYQLKSDILQRVGNSDEALTTFKAYKQLNDSLSNIGLVRKMERQRTDFEVSKREVTIKALEKVNSLRNIIISILVLGIIIIMFLLIFYKKLHRKLQKVNVALHDKGTELEIKNETIKEALIEKEALLKEIHHRVKNNIQIISSLLSLQVRQIDDKKAKLAFENSQKRVQTIARVHQLLYQSESIAAININEYITQLMGDINFAFSDENQNITHKISIENINIDVDKAIPIGIIINELATNSYKYAFNNTESGIVNISLIKTNHENKYELIYSDNGKGLPPNFDPLENKSLGLKLIRILSKQLGGNITYTSNNGLEFRLIF